MINILFIHQSAEMYGSDKTLLLLLQNLDKTKFYSVVVLPNNGPLKTALEQENIEVVIAPVLKLYRKMFTPINILKFIKDKKNALSVLDNLHKKHRFDMVYSNTLATLIGAFFAKKNKIKHLWHVHEIIENPKIIATSFPKILNKYADVIVCNSNATLQNLVKRIPDLEKKSTVIHNGSELKNLDSNSKKTDFGYTNQDIIITLVGRISRLKGHKWLLNTYINQLQKHQNIKILFVGSPVDGQEYYLHEIEKIIEINKLDNIVKILPFNKDLTSIWTITDIALMPSTEAESFGLVAVEAMLAKKPVIGSKHGGLTEIIIDNETGFLVEPNNEKALAEALSKLIKNESLRSSFGQNGYQRALLNFTVAKYVLEFEKLFSKMTNKSF